MHWTSVSYRIDAIEFLEKVLTFNEREDGLWKLYLKASFCAVTAYSKSKEREAYSRGVFGPFTPKLKTNILPTFERENG